MLGGCGESAVDKLNRATPHSNLQLDTIRFVSAWSITKAQAALVAGSICCIMQHYIAIGTAAAALTLFPTGWSLAHGFLEDLTHDCSFEQKAGWLLPVSPNS